MDVGQSRNAAFAVLERSRDHPAKTALLFDDSAIGFGELAGNCVRFARLLRARGLARGDCLALVLQNVPAFPFAFFGALLAGIRPVVARTDLALPDYAGILAETGAKGLAAAPGSRAAEAAAGLGIQDIPCGEMGPPGLSDLPVEPVSAPEPDPGIIIYTSGSTGRPKGVIHGPGNLFASYATAMDIMGLTGSDVVCALPRLFTLYGVVAGLCYPLLAGAATVLDPAKPEAVAIYRLIKRHRVTVMYAVPTIYSLMLKAWKPEYDLTSLRYGYCAGESLPAAVHEAWRRQTGIELVEGLGSTETGMFSLSNRPGWSRAGSAGRLSPGFAVRLVGADGRDVPSGEPGRLLVRGPSTAEGYLNRPELTAATMLEDGWLATGDIVREQDGWYVSLGRGDDMMKVCGEWVSPLVVEDALSAHPDVAECAVVGRTIEGLTWPAAFVVPRPGAVPGDGLAARLRRHMDGRLPRTMCPVEYLFVPTLPKNPAGKIMRVTLRQELAHAPETHRRSP